MHTGIVRTGTVAAVPAGQARWASRAPTAAAGVVLVGERSELAASVARSPPTWSLTAPEFVDDPNSPPRGGLAGVDLSSARCQATARGGRRVAGVDLVRARMATPAATRPKAAANSRSSVAGVPRAAPPARTR